MPSTADWHPSQKKVHKIKSQEDAKKEEEVAVEKTNTLRKTHIHLSYSHLPLIALLVSIP
jgi:hypothetical protein